MLYLDTWNIGRRKQHTSKHASVSQYPLTPQEREQAPGFRDWGTSHLLMMEQRLEDSIHVFAVCGRVRECFWTEESSEEGSDHSVTESYSAEGGDDDDNGNPVELFTTSSTPTVGIW